MLDPKIIKTDPQKIIQMLKARDMADEISFQDLENLDVARKNMMKEIDSMRNQKNIVSVQISEKCKRGENADKLIQEMRDLEQVLKEKEKELNERKQRYEELAYRLPNLIDPEVLQSHPTENFQIRVSSIAKPHFEFPAKNHIELSENLDLIDLERAAKVSGARFYYLKNDLVKLNHALIQYALDFLQEKKYSLIQPPYLINENSMKGAIIAADFKDVIYKVEKEDLYLIGTSEHAMAAMHTNEIINGKNLPLKYAGVSPCFRKEAGAHGKDQKGIFRVHQFEKVEQFIFAKPDESEKLHKEMLDNATKFYDSLEIPYRVMRLSSQDMGKVSAKTFDIEAWMPGQNAYREIVSCSNCWEFQARRLHIRYRDKTNEDTKILHTLNSTLIATTRVLVAIMENFQTKDGHFKIPKVLQKYMDGKNLI